VIVEPAPVQSGPDPRRTTVDDQEAEQQGERTAADGTARRPSRGVLAAVARRLAAARAAGEAGMSTAEYAVGTVAACAFAALLYKVVTGDSIVTALTDLIDSALSTLS
jgi:hypothetical protein